MSNYTTEIIRKTDDYFIANTEDGRIRIGLVGTESFDVPYRHDELLEIASISNDEDFNEAAEDLFYDIAGDF